ncbi:MAG: hypothetical protein M3Q69_04660 [Acidobacteriota bacterium]|nr:hypothetical protein [Acidobacteriota bacterium]
MHTRKVTPVVAALLALSLSFNSVLQAGSRRRVVAVSPASDLSLTFLDASQSAMPLLDAGNISWRGERRHGARTTRTFAMRIGPASHESRGTATVRAFLEHADPRATIRLDGIPLGATARIVQRHAPIGIAVPHRLEIEVPTTAAEGAIDCAIGWEVTTD